jgi:hypothetical protein
MEETGNVFEKGNTGCSKVMKWAVTDVVNDGSVLKEESRTQKMEPFLSRK